MTVPEKPESPSHPTPIPPIEDEFVTQPWVKGLTMDPGFQKILREWMPHLAYPRTGSRVLEAFSTLDVKADELARILSDNQYYEHQFRKMIESLGKRENVPSVNAAIVLLGMQRSRDLILALQLFRAASEAHPPWSDDGKLQLPPSEVLTFAGKVEEKLSRFQETFAATAYAGGVMFDAVMQLAKAKNADLKIFQPWIESVFAHGLKAGEVGIALGNLVPDFTLKKYLFSACLVHDIGKAIMGISDKTYIDFHADCGAKGLNRGLRQFSEKEKFRVAHETIGALYTFNFPVFESIAKAVLFHHEPYLLKTSSKPLYQLASMVALCSNVATHFKKATGPDDPVVQAWKGPELKDFPIEIPKLIDAVGKMQASK